MIESVSRRAFSSSSGTYNVRASELARESKLNILNVTVYFLDDTQHCFQIEKKAKGVQLLEQVFHHLELVEKDYFGLQYTENGSPPSATNTDVTRWLDASKSVKKQLLSNAQFWLAVRFYPPEPSRLAEEFTRYLLCLQLRKFLLDGRMQAPKNTMLLLASFTVQAELGDYNVSEHPPNYLSELRLVPKQTAEDERKISELHKLHRNQSPADAEANFLEHAKRLDCYGVESHPAKDCSGKDISIGVTSIGIVVFQNNIRINTFSWGKIVKISFKRKQFFIQLKREPSESYDTVLGFNMRSGRSAKALWRCSVERHGFFRLRAPKRRPLLSALGALAGIGAPRVPRTESQALEDARRSRSGNRTFVRRSSSRHRSLSSSAASPGLSALRTARVTTHRDPPPARRLDQARSQVSDVTAPRDPHPRAAWTKPTVSQVSDVTAPREPPPPPARRLDQARSQVSDVTAPRDPAPRAAWTKPAVSEGDFLEARLRVPLTYVDDTSSASEAEPEPSPPDYLERASPPDYLQGPEYMVVRLRAGPDGKFGLNVRGGRGAAVVSRVAPQEPSATHSLTEGDQIISINGVSVMDLTHEQVVMLIRNTVGVLTLVIKPNAVYDTEDTTEEPTACFVPLGAEQYEGDPTEQSMLLLGDCLASGAALRQFDALPRRLLDEPITASRLPANVPANRYRDIAPYDKTRVILKNGSHGDYINASYINMEIPNSDQVLTYIATQGPLPSTIGDFWQMVWESESNLIVMLTVLTELGRAKCAQYWARVGGDLRATSDLTATTASEQNHGHYVRRQITLKHTDGASRVVTQLQYTAWPDHGVPDDRAAFVRFTQLCTRLRRPALPKPVCELEGEDSILETPMIVHCSAGVGRTGALVLAELALALLRRRRPFYPLDAVRALRTMRAHAVQNTSQYKFVCESILMAYTQGLIDDVPDSDDNS
ncbi:tyrosine-protein phosphatase non-receptor type 4 [Plutella xylostella]|uniref:tyrosine-protein phosphatase non-receptor type 4 n=1 Tax=Plutella xylostella TaxID=51655 RepID=UPI00203258F1|nr:tyrosine-protein phosphatase non-receptor type 4 [Plutella xylostella]